MSIRKRRINEKKELTNCLERLLEKDRNDENLANLIDTKIQLN